MVAFAYAVSDSVINGNGKELPAPMSAPCRAQDRGQTLSLKAAIDHLDGIPSSKYEIGVFDPRAFNGDGRMLIRRWSRAEVINSFAWLRYSNAQGCNIYVRPAIPHPYTLLDDMSAEGLRQLDQEGFAPSVVVETSPGNFQAWLCGTADLAPALATQVARVIATRFQADLSSADYRHFGRLAGFTNRKPEHRNEQTQFHPYVRLILARPRIYLEAAATRVMANAMLEDAAVEEQRRRASSPQRAQVVTARKQITDFHDDPRYSGDLNRADLAYAIYALSHGVSPTDVAQHLQLRDLSKKGSITRQKDYIDRTLRKAERACTTQ